MLPWGKLSDFGKGNLRCWKQPKEMKSGRDLQIFVAAAPCWQLWASCIYCKKLFEPDLAWPSAGLCKRVWCDGGVASVFSWTSQALIGSFFGKITWLCVASVKQTEKWTSIDAWLEPEEFSREISELCEGWCWHSVWLFYPKALLTWACKVIGL